MFEQEVLEVVSALERAGCRFWIAGGWGVDAIVGAWTREHRDLDLALDAACETEVLGVLEGLGYSIETDAPGPGRVGRPRRALGGSAPGAVRR